jgi:hypothetical protein
MMSASCPGFLDQHGIWNNGRNTLTLFLVFSVLTRIEVIAKRDNDSVGTGTETMFEADVSIGSAESVFHRFVSNARIMEEFSGN